MKHREKRRHGGPVAGGVQDRALGHDAQIPNGVKRLAESILNRNKVHYSRY
jgi:hypothetical protein